MSIQFGVLNLNGNPVEPNRLAEARADIARYAHDRITVYVDGNVGVVYSEFRTKDANGELPPHLCATGTLCIWDGRLDNVAELARTVEEGLDSESPEAAIVSACYKRYGPDSFSNLIGDWALALWDPRNRALVLAKDFLGTRHLYYRVEGHQITWSTILDPLVLGAKGALTLNGEYIAGCLSHLPAVHLTPYAELHSVPPACYVLLKNDRKDIREYWRFDSSKTVRYRTDCEYEEHFCHSFGESVRRRLRSPAPVLAELSGGMDSSSIVCMADRLIGRREAAHPTRLDTISYYSNSEPDWEEQPFFRKVEEHRGRTGLHIHLGPGGFFDFDVSGRALEFVPEAARLSDAHLRIAHCVQSGGYRVMLSGLGGDEVTGGVPTPIPELTDLLAALRVLPLAHQLKQWALRQRRPWFHLLAETCRAFLPVALVDVPAYAKPALWIRPGFARRHRTALRGYPNRLRLFGPLPSFQQRVSTLEALRRRLAWSALSPDFPCEIRYPYLDRHLLEFLFAVPPDQLVRPGQRRSLMRRALNGIVPPEILNRKRKAFVSRAPRFAIKDCWGQLTSRDFLCSSLEIVDSATLLDALKRAKDGEDLPLPPLVRTLSLECWLRRLANRKVLAEPLKPDHPQLLFSAGSTP